MNKNSKYAQQLQTAISAAQSAAEIIQSHASGDLRSTEKFVADQSQGLVTVADLEAEKAIIKAIQSVFPRDALLAEESEAESDRSGKLWVIDPLDGTNNFAHRIPHYSVSIAYYENEVARCGVVINAATGDIFQAEQGRGAWFNRQPVHVNPQNSLEETIVGTGFYYDRGAMMKATLATMQDLFEKNVRGIRRFGSAALDLISVGVGRFGGYFEYQLSPWDFAAGKLFVEEAGGRVTDCRGNPLAMESSSVLASNALLHECLVELTRPRVDSLPELRR